MLGVAILVVTLGAALPVAAVGWLGAVGRLPPNRFAGVRTGYSLSSPERWYAVHRVAGPYLLHGAAVAFALGLAFAPFAIVGEIPDPVSIAVLGVQGAFVVAGALLGAFAGISRAKAAGT